MGWGDEIVAAGQAQRLYDADPSTRIAIVGQTGAPRWHDIWNGNPIIARPADVAAGEPVRRVVNGPGCRPYIVYPFDTETGWTFKKTFRCRDHIARIYLTSQEEQRGSEARLRFGPYVLIEPFTKHVNFTWPIERWHDLVAACPDLTFVQHVHSESAFVLGAHHILASFREAIALVAASEVYVRSESGLCHAAAAVGAHQVTLFGGCMDPEVMAYYPRQTVIADRGPGSPCGRWQRCQHCIDAMHRITVEDVVAAIRQQLAESEAA